MISIVWGKMVGFYSHEQGHHTEHNHAFENGNVEPLCNRRRAPQFTKFHPGEKDKCKNCINVINTWTKYGEEAERLKLGASSSF
jgi:hypothetical protein